MLLSETAYLVNGLNRLIDFEVEDFETKHGEITTYSFMKAIIRIDGISYRFQHFIGYRKDDPKIVDAINILLYQDLIDVFQRKKDVAKAEMEYGF